MTAKIGVVYYVDDPNKTVFRVVYPEQADTSYVMDDGYHADILDGPQWVSAGCDPARNAVLEKIDPTDLPNWKTGGVP